MQDDTEKTCPFLSSKGCGIYADRPSTCRYYPIGFAAQEKSDSKEEFYFLVREGHCLGFEEKKNWYMVQGARCKAKDLEPIFPITPVLQDSNTPKSLNVGASNNQTTFLLVMGRLFL